MRGQKERLHRWERSGDGTDDSVADGNAMQREKVCECRNGGQLGHFLGEFDAPGVAGTTRGKQLHGSTSPGFCVRENEKKGVTT